MKQELKSLKDSAIQVANEKENFKKQKKFFNMKVEEQKELLDKSNKIKIENAQMIDAKEVE